MYKYILICILKRQLGDLELDFCLPFEFDAVSERKPVSWNHSIGFEAGQAYRGK